MAQEVLPIRQVCKRVALVAFERNLNGANTIAEHLASKGYEVNIIPYHKGVFAEALKYDCVVAIMACGIVIREACPYLKNKWADAAIVVVDDTHTFAISLLGGHHGANEVVEALSEAGLVPVITTATSAHGRLSVEEIAKRLNCHIITKDATKHVNLALLEVDVDVLELHGPKVVMVDDDVAVLKRG